MIKLLSKDSNTSVNLSEKYAGKLPIAIIEKLQAYRTKPQRMVLKFLLDSNAIIDYLGAKYSSQGMKFRIAL